MATSEKQRPEMITESVSIATLTADPANARRHTPRNLEAIRKSLRRFGQQKPIVIDATGQVVAGHGVLEAARSLGWEQVAIVRTELTGAEAAAFAIADNRVGELSEWDQTTLAATLASLNTGEPLDDLVPGFDAAEIDQLIQRAQIDTDIGHFVGVAQAARATSGTTAGLTSVAPLPTVGHTATVAPNPPAVPGQELSLVITGPRAVIDTLRVRINDARQRHGLATLAEALLTLVQSGDSPS